MSNPRGVRHDDSSQDETTNNLVKNPNTGGYELPQGAADEQQVETKPQGTVPNQSDQVVADKQQVVPDQVVSNTSQAAAQQKPQVEKIQTDSKLNQRDQTKIEAREAAEYGVKASPTTNQSKVLGAGRTAQQPTEGVLQAFAAAKKREEEQNRAAQNNNQVTGMEDKDAEGNRKGTEQGLATAKKQEEDKNQAAQNQNNPASGRNANPTSQGQTPDPTESSKVSNPNFDKFRNMKFTEEDDKKLMAQRGIGPRNNNNNNNNNVNSSSGIPEGRARANARPQAQPQRQPSPPHKESNNNNKINSGSVQRPPSPTSSTPSLLSKLKSLVVPQKTSPKQPHTLPSELKQQREAAKKQSPTQQDEKRGGLTSYPEERQTSPGRRNS